MCVTNITKRRPAAAVPDHLLSNGPSLITQRLGFNGALPTEASSTVPTAAATEKFAPAFAAQAPFFGMAGSSVCFQQPEEQDCNRPRRRRKPQKPGKTAKLQDRHFVVHDYHDHANDPDETDLHFEAPTEAASGSKRRGGVAVSFPMKLHAILDQVEADGLSHIISWQPHGRCFVIHKPKDFCALVMPKYFRQSKLTSFQRQLNLYGFNRLTKGHDSGGYYHELFLRGKTHLCKRMVRTKVKGTKFKAASSPEQEPDFYRMKPVTVTPHNSSGDESSTNSDAYGLSRKAAIAHKKAGTSSLYQDQGNMFPPMQTFVDPLDPIPLNGSNFMNVNTFVPQQAPVVSNMGFSMFGGMNSFGLGGSNMNAPLQNDDDLFDEAIDQVCGDDEDNSNGAAAQPLQEDAIMNQVLESLDVSDIWDAQNDGFAGAGSIEDDQQLGFLLEKMLQE